MLQTAAFQKQLASGITLALAVYERYDHDEAMMSMKKVSAVIRAHKLIEVRDALLQLGVGGITVMEAMGYGRQHGHTESYRGAEYKVEFVSKVMVEVIIAETMLPDVMAAIQKAAQTGKVGDGKIFVEPVEEVLRIRTGERGLEAV